MLVHERAKLGVLYRVGFKDNLKAQISMQAYEAYQNHALAVRYLLMLTSSPTTQPSLQGCEML
jgi:hypothetical protein